MRGIGAGFGVGSEFVSRSLRIASKDATELMQRLCDEGYVEPIDFDATQNAWQIGSKGRTLANATFAKPLTAKTAQGLVDTFVARCAVIDSDDGYFKFVREAWLFGSFARGEERPSDVDIFVELVDKEPRTQESMRKHAKASGRRFATYLDQLGWPEHQALLYLKQRSSGLSLHTMDEQAKQLPEARLIYKSQRTAKSM